MNKYFLLSITFIASVNAMERYSPLRNSDTDSNSSDDSFFTEAINDPSILDIPTEAINDPSILDIPNENFIPSSIDLDLNELLPFLDLNPAPSPSSRMILRPNSKRNLFTHEAPHNNIEDDSIDLDQVKKLPSLLNLDLTYSRPQEDDRHDFSTHEASNNNNNDIDNGSIYLDPSESENEGYKPIKRKLIVPKCPKAPQKKHKKNK
jgi:hypothetical protein